MSVERQVNTSTSQTGLTEGQWQNKYRSVDGTELTISDLKQTLKDIRSQGRSQPPRISSDVDVGPGYGNRTKPDGK